ncbi:hypothetical protein BGX31_006703 [Mortierella sp. GBA43]|nr:hypothetical protein BGX31_006703 [Mortierella sp. GBA43]
MATSSDESLNSFPGLVELDALHLTVIVDNEVDIMSSAPIEIGQSTQAGKLYKDKRNIDLDKSTQPEGQPHPHAHGEQTGCPTVRTVAFDFNDLCCGAHGLSILVTGVKDGVEHRVLFDTGPQPSIFLENARRLEIEFGKIEVIVLSHWHIDHSGGMLAAVDKIRDARSKQGLAPVLVDLHPDRPDQRGACLTKPSPGSEDPIEYVAWGKDPSFKDLESTGGKVWLNDKAHTVCDGFFGVSGLIPRQTSYETGIPSHVRWSEDTKSWRSEPEIMDERYLVARVKSKGVVVLTGCSHAGVINVCKDVKRALLDGNAAAGEPGLFFVVGGFHLSGASVETRIQEINPSFMAPGHCSGWRSKLALEKAMPGRVISLGVGNEFLISKQDA